MSINNQRILKAIARIENELDSLKLSTRITQEGEEGDDNTSGDLNNYYTKTETDNKFALKTEIPEDVDLSNYYTKNETYT